MAARTGPSTISSTIVPAFSQALWTISPFLSPAGMRALRFASPTFSNMLLPVSQRASRADELARELLKLPFEYQFMLPPIGPEGLGEAAQVLRMLRPLRRWELVAQGAGCAPTELDGWCFKSRGEMAELMEAAQAAIGAAKHGSRPTLLLAAVLRRAEEQALNGPMVTASMGLEWIEGPAADPLQLALRLAIGSDDQVKVELEVGSGAWTPWAETWALHDSTLEARVAVAAVLPGGGRSLIVQDFRGSPTEAIEGAPLAEGYEAEGVAALREALATTGAEGVRAVVCIGRLSWGKDAPVWCPPDVRKVVMHRCQ